MRGKVKSISYNCLGRRITPACAGKSFIVKRDRKLFEDHPRVCGEKGLCSMRGYEVEGSPPRVRGKAVHAAPERQPQGITPACAGKSALYVWNVNHDGDHPRVCGEKLCRVHQNQGRLGSPPRVRGKVAYWQYK